MLVIIDWVAKRVFGSVVNTGGVFGMFHGWNSFFIVFSIIVICGIVYFLHKGKYIFELVLILAGVIGNLIDRVFYLGVVDFIDVGFWPVFNLADVFIFFGAVLLLRKVFKLGESKK